LPSAVVDQQHKRHWTAYRPALLIVRKCDRQQQQYRG